METLQASTKGILMRLSDFKAQAVNLVRSSIIGTWIGILPGVGASVGSIMSYTVAKNFSKNPKKFGTGYEGGIVASEAGNNAVVGGALIPLITFGIPGSTADAILLAALILHNIQPGPRLFTTNPDLVWAIIAACMVANILMFVIMTGTVRYIAKLMAVPRAYLLPVVFVFCVIGSYAVHNNIFDVWTMLGFGVLGYLLSRADVPLGPFVIGFVLAPIAETELRSGLMISNGDWWPLVTRPLSGSFLLISVIFLFYPLIQEWRSRRRDRAAGLPAAEPTQE